MKLSVSQVEIRNDATGDLAGTVSRADDGAIRLELFAVLDEAGSWRELADAVAQAIKMMEAE